MPIIRNATANGTLVEFDKPAPVGDVNGSPTEDATSGHQMDQ